MISEPATKFTEHATACHCRWRTKQQPGILVLGLVVAQLDQLVTQRREVFDQRPRLHALT